MGISHRHTPFAYPEFTPLRPWEEVAKIAEKKEANYVEGSRIIQDNINSYATLPVTREVARDYLKKRVDELTSIANKYAGEDFSNTSVVTQLTRIGDPIGKDPYIINEIRSTNEAMRRQETMKSLKPEQRSPANDWEFMRDYSAWRNSNDLNKTLEYREYKPYEDLSKLWSEVYKELKDSGQITSSIETLANGYIVGTKTGGLDAQRLSQAFSARLNGSQRGQLYIDAAYDLSIKGPEVAYQVFAEHYNNVAKVSDEKVSLLEQEIVKQRNLVKSSNDPLAKKELVSLEAELQEARIASKVARNKVGTYNASNLPESEYMPMYINNFVDNLANAYQYRQVEQTIKSDPTWVARFHESNANYRAKLDRESNERIAAEKLNKEATNKVEEAEVKDLRKTVPVYNGELDQSNLNLTSVDERLWMRDLINVGTLTNLAGKNASYKKTMGELLSRFVDSGEDGKSKLREINPEDEKSFRKGMEQFLVNRGGGAYQKAHENENFPRRYQDFKQKMLNISQSLESFSDNEAMRIIMKNENNNGNHVMVMTKNDFLNNRETALFFPFVEGIYKASPSKKESGYPYIPPTIVQPETE